MPEEKLELQTLFLHSKPSKILLGMKTNKPDKKVYASVLAKEADCTYSHTIKILDFLQKAGLVEFEKKGRIKHVALTNHGWDIAHNLEAMLKKFTDIGEIVKTGKKEKREEKTKK